MSAAVYAAKPFLPAAEKRRLLKSARARLTELEARDSKTAARQREGIERSIAAIEATPTIAEVLADPATPHDTLKKVARVTGFAGRAGQHVNWGVKSSAQQSTDDRRVSTSSRVVTP